MGINILDIGSTALLAAQAGIATTAHNISNASTPGYARQEAVQVSNLAMKTGSGYFGQGVHVQTVQRVYSNFLTQQVKDAQSAASETDLYHTQASQIDNLLGDSTTGVSPALQNFFSSINNLANNPADVPTRQAMLSSSQSLVGSLQSMQSSLDQIRHGNETQISANVASINSYASQIAKLNNSIALAEGANNGQPANDLRDQRDQLVADLSKQVKTSLLEQSDGTYNIYIGSGQPLVLGGQAANLVASPSPGDNTQLQISYQMNGITSAIKDPTGMGGQLGALLSFRSDMLDTAQNNLGRIALGLAGSVNAQNKLGLDLNGAPGGNLFNITQPVPIANSANTGNASLTVSYSDFSALTTSDYSIGYDGSNYTVTRLSDGVAQQSASLPMNMDGLAINMTSGAMAAGDSFLLRPTRDGANAISVAISDPSKIAAATPIQANPSVSNIGTGSLSAGAVDSTYPSSPLGANLTLSFDSTSGTLSGFPAGAAINLTQNGTTTTYPAGSNVPFASGATISFAGMSFALAGTPSNGDQFVISPNTNGVGDNRNALLLAGLQSQKTLAAGTASFMDAYGQMVAQVGNQASSAQVNSQTQDKLLQEAQSAQQAVSGVNLDEEASNLLRYQQAYQAAGKVMQITSQLFTTLLQIGS
ncbi:MAG: flagellar hook-associated protein FlgK [Thiobacillaceae bacterium]|jgi:flagellar hook-associated protein 1 FlgK